MSADIVSKLRPIRLPANFATFNWHDHLAAFALGVFAALAVAAIFAPLMTLRRSPVRKIRLELEALRRLPPAERLYRQATILSRLGATPREAMDWRAALYRPGVSLDLDALDREIVSLVRQRA